MKLHFWHTAFAILFTTLSASGYAWLSSSGLLTPDISVVDLSLMALAIMRLIRLFTKDIITAFIRNWFDGADSRTLRGTFGDLLHCPWCSGLWFTLFVVFFYYATPIAWYAILVLALSSIASFLQVFTNFIGWSAEEKKARATGSSASSGPVSTTVRSC